MATINSAQSGPWHDGATWVGSVMPGSSDTAVIGSHTITVSVDGYLVQNVVLSNNDSVLDVNADKTLRISGNLTIGGANATIQGEGTVRTDSGLVLNADLTLNGHLSDFYNGSANIEHSISGSGVLNVSGTYVMGSGADISGITGSINQLTINDGQLHADAHIDIANFYMDGGTWGDTGETLYYNPASFSAIIAGGTVIGNGTFIQQNSGANIAITGGTFGVDDTDHFTFKVGTGTNTFLIRDTGSELHLSDSGNNKFYFNCPVDITLASDNSTVYGSYYIRNGQTAIEHTLGGLLNSNLGVNIYLTSKTASYYNKSLSGGLDEHVFCDVPTIGSLKLSL